MAKIVGVGDAAQRQHLDLAAFVDPEGAVPPFDHGDTAKVLATSTSLRP